MYSITSSTYLENIKNNINEQNNQFNAQNSFRTAKRRELNDRIIENLNLTRSRQISIIFSSINLDN